MLNSPHSAMFGFRDTIKQDYIMDTDVGKIAIKIEPYFWVGYLLLILASGSLRYDFLPNESYDEAIHDLVEYHHEEGGVEGMLDIKVPDIWKDEESGEVFSREEFSEHRANEARRIALTAFLYGIFGCVFYAVTYLARNNGKYVGGGSKKIILEGFRNALIVNVVIAGFFYVFT